MRQQRSEETTGARRGHACCNPGPVGSEVSPTSERKWFGNEVPMVWAPSPKGVQETQRRPWSRFWRPVGSFRPSAHTNSYNKLSDAPSNAAKTLSSP